MAVLGGTCRRAAIPGIPTAGKTGTAQNPHGKDHSAFMGFAPYEEPRIAVAAPSRTPSYNNNSNSNRYNSNQSTGSYNRGRSGGFSTGGSSRGSGGGFSGGSSRGGGYSGGGGHRGR